MTVFLLYIFLCLCIIADDLAGLYASSAMLRTVSPHSKAPRVTTCETRLDGGRISIELVLVKNVYVISLHKNLSDNKRD